MLAVAGGTLNGARTACPCARWHPIDIPHTKTAVCSSAAREGVGLDVSTLADWVGACSATLAPLVELIRRHVLAADRIHGDDTTVPVLAKNKTVTGRLWTYVRDDRLRRQRPAGRHVLLLA